VCRLPLHSPARPHRYPQLNDRTVPQPAASGWRRRASSVHRPPEATIIPDVYGARGIYKKAVAARTGVLLPFYGGRNPVRGAARFPKTRIENEAVARQRLSPGKGGKGGAERIGCRVSAWANARETLEGAAHVAPVSVSYKWKEAVPIALITLTRRAEISRGASRGLIMASLRARCWIKKRPYGGETIVSVARASRACAPFRNTARKVDAAVG